MNRSAGLWMALLLTASFPLLAPPAESATVAYTLHGSLGGWGFTAGSISNPGPLLTAAEGDTVDLTLFGADASPHTWLFDEDNDQVPDVTEPESSTLDTTFSFTASYTPGMYGYLCGNHGSSMRGPFRIDPAGPAPPSVVFVMPNGLQDWTGGITHNVSWTMTDVNEPETNLRAWVNYTSSAGNGTIAGPVAGSTNPHSAPWTVPLVDVSDMAVTVIVFDSGGLNTTRTILVPTVDSTPPAVASILPIDGTIDVAVNDNVVLTFTEPMNQAATQVATTLSSIAGPVAVTPSWSGGQLTMNPSGPLQPQTVYWTNITIAAEDDSDPGSPMTSAVSYTFTTIAPPSDTNPPTAVITPPSGTIQVSAPITFVGKLSADVDGPIASWNWTVHDSLGAPIGTGTLENLTFAFPSAGTYTVELNVTDGASNWNVTQITAIAQNAPLLAVSVVTAVPLDVTFGSSVNLSAAVTGGTVAVVWIEGVGIPNATASFDSTGGRYFRVFTPTLPLPTWSFIVAAVNPTGQWATGSGGFQVTVSPPILYGSAGGGWGPNSISMTNPGPTLTMNAGDTLRVTLVSLDGLSHYFFVDTDGSGTYTGAEPRSPEFQGLAAFAVVDITGLPPGTYPYYCGNHPAAMSGELRVLRDTIAPQSFPWVLVLLFLLMVIVLVVVFLIRRRRQKPSVDTPTEPSAP